MAVETRGMTTLIQVFDMKKSLEFYCGILGFELLETAGPADDIGWVILKLNEVYLMLNTQYEMPGRPQNADPERIKAHGDTCFYFMCVDPDDIYEQIIKNGIAAEKPEIAPYGMKQLYFSDPDGYRICFQSAVSPVNH
jgi:glyoxylase I family protein